jgi:hypothetical protein
MPERNTMASAPKVMNRITLVTKSITPSGEKGPEKAKGKNRIFRASLQMLTERTLLDFFYFPDISGESGTTVAVEQSALKTQITILERREQ